MPSYELNIDGPLLRKQRQHLLNLRCQAPPRLAEILDGIISMTDEIADQAHDKYGIDCLLTPDKEPPEITTTFSLEVSHYPDADVDKMVEALDTMISTAQSTAGLLDEAGIIGLGSLDVLAAPSDHKKGFVIYDFDAGDLVTTTVYEDCKEAQEDAAELNNTLVLALPLP